MTERHATPETIDAVKAKAKPGDTIHLGPGNYNRSTLEGLPGVRLIGSGPGMSGYTELRPTNDDQSWVVKATKGNDDDRAPDAADRS